MDIAPDRRTQFLRLITVFLNNLLQNGIIYELCHAELSGIALHKVSNVYHHIGKNLDVSLLCLYIYIRNSGILNGIGQFCRHPGACLCQDLSRCNINHILSQNGSADTVSEHQLFIEFISADLGKIISSGVKKHSRDQAFCAVHGKRLTGTDLLI